MTRRMPWPIVLILLVVIAMLLLRQPAPAPTLHERIQQRLIEAELGSSTTFHLAAGPRAAQPPGEEPLSEVLAQLRSNSPEQRWEAAREISARRDPRAVEFVIDAMRDPKDTVRVCLMASTLGYLRDPRALGPLTEAAFDPNNRDLRLCAIESLGMLGDPRAVPDLIRALEARNMPVTAANALARLGDARAVAPIIAAAQDPELVLWMITALGELGNADALSWLQARASGQHQDARLNTAVNEAIWKIQHLSTADATQALAGVLARDNDVGHRSWAAFRMGEAGRAEAVPSLLRALSDPDDGVRERAAAALIRIGAPARPAVLTHGTQTGQGQSYAVAVLGYLGEPADLQPLQALADGSNTAIIDIAERSMMLIQRFHRKQELATRDSITQ